MELAADPRVNWQFQSKMALKSETEENFGTLFNNFDGVDPSVGCCQRLIKVCHLTRAPTSRLGAIIMWRRDNERLENFLS